MDASILDLRYKMRDVLKALDSQEKVRILYHGKIKGEITPPRTTVPLKTKDHPLFGSCASETRKPEEIVFEMRRRRSNGF